MKAKRLGSSSTVPQPTADCNRGTSRIPCASPVSSPHSSSSETPSVQYIAGLDKLLVSFWLGGPGHKEFMRKLEDFKQEFRDEHLCKIDCPERTFHLGWEGVRFNMQRVGTSHYPYRLQTGDITLLFNNHKTGSPIPNCRLEIGSMSCWLPGWEHVYERFLAMLAEFECVPKKERITRNDITADFSGVDFSETGLDNRLRWLTTASKIKPIYEHLKPSYVALESKSVYMRCYDKTGEFISNHDDVKRDFFHSFWFDRLGCVPEHVTRIEVQLKREICRELGIDTVADLRKRMNSIWQYFVGAEGQPGWARFAATEVPLLARLNKHQTRYETDSFWKIVQSVRFSDHKPERIKRCVLKPQRDVSRLEKQGASCLLNACAAKGLHPDDLYGQMAHCYNVITREFEAFYQEKRKEYVRKFETIRTSVINTLFADSYETPEQRDSFAQFDRPRQYYRVDSNYVWKVYGAAGAS